jgi:hypothetical protein
VLRSVNDDPERLASLNPEPDGKQDFSAFLDQYRPMLKLLSAPDVAFLRCQHYSEVRHFRRERAAIYFEYLYDLYRDVRSLPLWTAPQDGEAFIELDKASWTTHKLLVKLALEGALYYVGIQRHDTDLVERCFEQLGSLFSAVA